jgi:hypothetical protein
MRTAKKIILFIAENARSCNVTPVLRLLGKTMLLDLIMKLRHRTPL